MCMRHRKNVVTALLVWALTTSISSIRAQAPLTIENLTDSTRYNNSTFFRVPTAGGHTYSVKLDGQAVPTDVTIPITAVDYHELWVSRTNVTTGDVTNRLIRFLVRNNSGRGTTEDGLPTWTPYPVINSSAGELAGAHLEIITPEAFPADMEIPVVAWIRKDQGQVVRGNGLLTAPAQAAIQLRRGVGSGFLAATNLAGPLNYAVQLPGIQTNKTINVESGTVWTSVSGTLSGNVTWGADSRMAVTGSISITAGSRLTILDGSIVRLNSGVNIVSAGEIVISGTANRPVVLTPVNRSQPWGGFFLTNSTSALDANGAIFIASGAAQSGYPGHRGEQPLFFLDNRARAALTNCAAIYSAGQFFHSYDRPAPYASFTMVGSLIQRCTTGGEFNSCSLRFLQSAFIEVPFDSGDYGTVIDSDYDGFYLNTGMHELRDSLIGWVKDDCMDSGSGGGPSTVTVSNCWLEAAYHEACAWSGGGRTTTNLHLVTINSGQGIEAGWSSGSGITPNVFVNDCLSLANAIGTRFGDNYDWDYWGYLRVTNSILLHNHRDVWGMNWDNWRYGINTRDGTSAMNIQGNSVSVPGTNHPNNTRWNASQDGWRLAAFMTTPPDAPVGVGIAVWANQLGTISIFDGVPVRLSSFTTNSVSVDYAFQDGSGRPLATGSLTFAPGETVKRIYPAGFNASDYFPIGVVLTGATNGELTGQTNYSFLGRAPPVTVSCWVGTNQMDLARLGEGVPVVLKGPSAQSVSVDYRFQGVAGVLAQGTVVFQPGETAKWIYATGVIPQEHELIGFKLSNPVSAQLASPSNVYFVKAELAPIPASTTLIARGSRWKYRDLASDPGATWRSTNYNDAAWPSGLAQLGFSYADPENDEATLIADNDQLTSYFRQTFPVADPAVFAGLSLWLLRDDGGVVFLNGSEIFRSSSLPAPPTPITYSTLAGNQGDNVVDTATLGATNLLAGTNWAAVEIHQQNATSSDVSFDFELVGNPAPPPAPPQRVHAGVFDGELVVAWGDSRFLLEEADAVTGPWQTVSNNSPTVVSLSPTISQKYYRLRKP